MDVVEYADLATIGHIYLPELDKFGMSDLGADYVYSGQNPIPFMSPNGLFEIMDFEVWRSHTQDESKFPLFNLDEYLSTDERSEGLNFISVDISSIQGDLLNNVNQNTVLILSTSNEHALAEIRRFFFRLVELKIDVPVIIRCDHLLTDLDITLLYAATDVGGLLLDGFGDGVMLGTSKIINRDRSALLNAIKFLNETAFGILQAARTRMSKTEYISCPSCGRTLFDLQQTTATIRQRTDHLKGIKIGIMGCIVNGPGEMADADYGYVGSGKGKITLYKGQEVIKRGIASEKALDELIEIIKENGDWKNPN